MSYIEFEKSRKDEDWAMLDLHSHKHYEIYFLSKGNRSFFLADSLYKINAPTLVVIPPNAVHKTEGQSFERHNVNVSEEYLSAYEKHVLDEIALKFIKLTPQESKTLSTVLNDAYSIDAHEKFSQEKYKAVFSYFIHLLSNLSVDLEQPKANFKNAIPPLYLKILDYLNTHFAENITLDVLSKAFFIPKPTLTYNFKKHVGKSPIDFLVDIRLAKAKQMLVSSKKKLEEIAFLNGFSSANYFGLIFKKREGLAPSSYRKNQIAKQY